MKKKDFSITYVLYSHFSSAENEDYSTYINAKNKGEDLDFVMRNLQGIISLKDYFRGLGELLNTPGHEGILVLFYAAGFEDFLDNLTKTKPELLKDHDKLDFAMRFADVFTSEVQLIEETKGRIRMVTSLDLHDILGRVHTTIADKAHVNVVGPEPGIRYDSPKIPEAILRLRLLGHGVPILRIDQDVLFRNKHESDLGLFKAVSCAVLAYKLRLQNSSVATSMFSASYNTKALIDNSLAPDLFEAWGRSFATRIHPALMVDVKEIKRIYKITDEKERNVEWDLYAKNNVNIELAKAYYGLDDSLIKVNRTDGLIAIGAHPFHSVISGALLCLSDGAILDLPPFSNFGFNVMWIDDHLKYSLHREMRHFTSADELQLSPDLGAARLSGVFVTKARPPVSNLPGYTLGIYLPTLLWGTIVDAWITPDPILKMRFGSLNSTEQIKWHKVRNTMALAPLPHAMREALTRGNLSPQAAQSLKNKLISVAVERIKEVRDLWIGLETKNTRTFASYWAAGEVKDNFPKVAFEKFDNDWWQGISRDDITQFKDLPKPLIIAVEKLADDAVKYIEWTLEWPKYIQIVRSVEQGTFVGDLTWEPPS